jgi:hypothetical protein
MDRQFAKMLVDYVSAKYGVNPPSIVYTDDLPARGVYMDSRLDTIGLRSDATIFTVLHEVGHKIFHFKGVTFRSELEEEMAANNFAVSELSELGLRLSPERSYLIHLYLENPQQAQLLSHVVVSRQDMLGLTVESYSYTPYGLTVQFKPYNPVSQPYFKSERTKYVAPIVWAIIGLAVIAGVAIIAWKVQEITKIQIPEWVPAVAVVFASTLGIYALSKLAEALK